MALIVQQQGTSSESIRSAPRQCHTCKLRKAGLFGLDENGNPRCSDCCRAVGKPID